MADTKDPVRQLIEVVVYAPVGLMLLVQRELPALAAAGKSRVESQVTLAKFIGKMAITRGGQELKRRLDAAEAARVGAPIEVEADSREDDWREDDGLATSNDVGSLPETVIAVVDAEIKRGIAEPIAVAADTPIELPIDGYDSLAASQVVVRLATLTDDELSVIRSHESTHRNRRTILGKISQIQAR